jgi:hypothetical protein
MVSLLSFLSLLFAFTAQAGVVPSGVPSLGLGGASTSGSAVMPNLVIPEANTQGYFTIYCAFVPGSNGYVAPFYKNGALYQVTTGKTFKVVAIMFMGDASGVGTQLLSSASTFATDSAVAGLTTPLYQGGTSGKYVHRTATANVYNTYYVSHDFTSLTWPGCQGSSTGNSISVIVIGKEI